MLSKSQVDKIGDSLRSGAVDAEVLRRLERYRSEFTDAYSYVEYILADKLLCTVTGRPTKSTLAIIEKLRRLRARLSQVQDIAGCRVIVNTLGEQDDLIRTARQWLTHVDVDDKREDPTHGYRAVHLLVTYKGKIVEVQIRTRAQHFWASISEKLADTFGQDIKYGKGDEEALHFLVSLSEEMRVLERIFERRVKLRDQIAIAQSSFDRKKSKDLRKIDEGLNRQIRHAMYRAKKLFEPIEKRQLAEVS